MSKKLTMADTKHLHKCSAKELQMIQKKYDGASLEELKDEFGYSDKIAVANLFTPSGKLRNPYDEYKMILHDAFLEECLNLQKKAVLPAMKLLVKNLASPNGNVANASAKYILDRELGSPKQQVEHSGEQPVAIIINPPAEYRQPIVEGEVVSE